MRLRANKYLTLLFSALVIAAVPPTSAQKHAIDYRVGDVKVCGRIDGLSLDAPRRCSDERREFQSGEQVCLYTRFENPKGSHRHRVIAYLDGIERFVRDDAGEHIESGRADDEWWTYCEPDIALPGSWRFDLYTDVGAGYEVVGSRSFAVYADALYEFVGAQSCGRVTADADGWRYECAEPRTEFVASERARMVAEFRNVIADHRFRVETRRDGALVRTQTTDWNRVDGRWERSYFVPEVDTAPGDYEFEFFIDVGSGFEQVGSQEFSVGVLAPVDGPVRAQCHWPSRRGTWAFCKHRRSGPHASHGVALADDSAAWDINLRDYEDAGEWVYAVAPGRVVRYGGRDASRYNGAAGVLIEHETADGDRWWSGYLHMRRDSVIVNEGDLVDVDTPIGQIGRTGTSNSHLHAVVYRGENRPAGLRSFDASFIQRDQKFALSRRIPKPDRNG